jgi:hypothetical protein
MTQKITIEVPDDFTEAQIKAVKEYAMVQVERFVRINEEIPVATKEANDLKVDDLRVKSGLEKAYEVARV